ncbi:MAG: hypothetical protein V2J12_11480 [Gammaproteobacteria bacterium]|jgi:hypothetical protein|nr:hypothetical protein [Gammaproteobacteria bacterium]
MKWFTCVVGLLLCVPAYADDSDFKAWPTFDRIRVGAAVFFPNLETQVSASDRQGLAGTNIVFERDLGLADSKSTALAFLEWRVFKRHALGLNYFKLDRSGSQVSDIVINFDGQQFSTTSPIQAFFDITAVELNYRYSILLDARKDWYVGVGLAAQELGFGLQGRAAVSPGTVVSENVRATAPLPTLATGFKYAVSEKWLLSANVGYFAVDLDLDDNENFDGSVWNSSIGVRWQAFEHLAFDLAYTDFRVDVDYEKRDLLANIDYEYRGPALGLSVNF